MEEFHPPDSLSRMEALPHAARKTTFCNRASAGSTRPSADSRYLTAPIRPRRGTPEAEWPAVSPSRRWRNVRNVGHFVGNVDQSRTKREPFVADGSMRPVMVGPAGKRAEPVYAQDNLIARVVELSAWLGRLPQAKFKWDCDRVDLAFATTHLRSVCENRRRAKAAVGADAAYQLVQRLADLSASATVAELSDLFGDDIVDRSPSVRSLRLQAGYNLVFCAGHVVVPLAEDGATDWTKVTRIRVLALEARNA
jgi:hypothetical protein